MKKRLFSFALLVVMILMVGTIDYAAYKYRYPNSYVMEYNLYAVTVGGSSGGGAYTSTESEAISFVSLFSYKNGVAKNSNSSQQDYYVYLAIAGNGGNLIKSTHALKYPSGTPCGETRNLEID